MLRRFAPLAPCALTALVTFTGPAYADLPTPQDPHPPALFTADCDFHGTNSPHDATYETFAASLVGPKGNVRSLRSLVETHQVGGASVVIIEGGEITQHHWYGCQDRKRRIKTTGNTLYQAASLSKFVSAIGMVHADRHGDLDLDDNMDVLADEFPDSLLRDWTRDNFNNDEDDFLDDITIRRLLNHSAGLDTHGIGIWSPTNVPTMNEIILGTSGFDNSFLGGVEPIHTPGTIYDYSGGGFILAEHILELHSPLSFKEYLDAHVLDLANLPLSTFAKGTTAMTNLVRGCSRSSCLYDLLQTNVKAAGGLLANAREYAEIVSALANDGFTSSGEFLMEEADIEQLLRPAAAAISTFDSCSTPGATRNLYYNVAGFQVFFGTEHCVGGTWRIPLMNGSQWYGLGLSLYTSLAADGFPNVVTHGGDQDGTATFFEINRTTGNGVVIMINGVEEWVDGDGFTYGAQALRSEIKQAWFDTYID